MLTTMPTMTITSRGVTGHEKTFDSDGRRILLGLPELPDCLHAYSCAKNEELPKRRSQENFYVSFSDQ